jgi:hypothetical protein
LSAGEVRHWAIELLRLQGEVSDVHLIGSHSAKATTLSWLSKVGATPSDRKFLGYHIDAADVTMATYSRDCASGPLRTLAKLLLLIRMDLFKPDSTRSGYMAATLAKVGFRDWHEGLSHALPEGNEPEQQADDVDELDWYRLGSAGLRSEPSLPNPLSTFAFDASSEDEACPPLPEAQSSDDSSSSSEGSVFEEGGAEAKPLADRFFGAAGAEVGSGLLFFHECFKTIHCLEGVGGSVFGCGRRLRPGYVQMSVVQKAWPKCKTCFGSPPPLDRLAA